MHWLILTILTLIVALLGSCRTFPDDVYTDEEIIDEARDFKFILYTRQNPLQFYRFELNDISELSKSHFNASLPLKVLIHGWKGSCEASSVILLKNEYNTNVVIVDWAKYSKIWWYPKARSKVPLVGRIVAFMIDEMVTKLRIKMKDVHIIGHSLGAHIAGVAGLKTKRGAIARVTGLDPAGPLFSLEHRLRLSRDSAKFVDVIHTDAYAAGFPDSLGHADFYPNGGFAIQPGCTFDLGTIKSHRRSYWLFAESILTPGGFRAKFCEDWGHFKTGDCSSDEAEMGEHVSQTTRGAYYLVTNYKTPFALGDKSLVYH